MVNLELMTHPWFVRLKPVVPAFIWVTTVGTFLLDLYVPLGFAPWVFYFFLAFVVSRFYPSRVLLLSTMLWSVLVLSGAVSLAKAETRLRVSLIGRSVWERSG